MNSVVMQKLEVYTETAFANKTAKVSESSPQKEGCGDFFLSSCIGDSCGACERCQWQESLLRGRVSCSWSQALGCRTWWQYNVESKTNKVLLYCFNKDALTEHSWHRAEYLFILLLSQKKKASGEMFGAINEFRLNQQLQRWGCCRWEASVGDAAWFMTISRVIHPLSASHLPKPLGQPRNKYRCWHTDSTSHGSRQSMLWVDWIWPHVHTWHPPIIRDRCLACAHAH